MLIKRSQNTTNLAQKNYQALLTWQQQVGIAKKIDYRQLIENGHNHPHTTDAKLANKISSKIKINSLH